PPFAPSPPLGVEGAPLDTRSPVGAWGLRIEPRRPRPDRSLDPPGCRDGERRASFAASVPWPAPRLDASTAGTEAASTGRPTTPATVAPPSAPLTRKVAPSAAVALPIGAAAAPWTP